MALIQFSNQYDHVFQWLTINITNSKSKGHCPIKTLGVSFQ